MPVLRGVFSGGNATLLYKLLPKEMTMQTHLAAMQVEKKVIKENVTIMVGQRMEARDKLLLLVLWKSGKSWCYKYIHLLLMEYAANKRMW